MYIIYPPETKQKKAKVNIEDLDPVLFYGRHYINGLILFHLVRYSKQFDIKQRANIELDISQKKQNFWLRKLEGHKIASIHNACRQVFVEVIPGYTNLL